ncbi:MAG: Fic family protein [Bacteroidales bacterium]
MKSFTAPSFTISSRMLELVASVSEKSGAINALFLNKIPLHIQTENRFESIVSGLLLDGNNLNRKQIHDILMDSVPDWNNKETKEILNLLAVYKKIGQWHPYSFTSFCAAHRTLMDGLSESAGHLRTQNVGIRLYRKKIKTAPDPKHLESLLENLFSYVKTSRDLLLVRSCVFFYEISFIHPFEHGNGRLARIWLKILLNEYNPAFGSLAIESLMLSQKQQMHDVLSRCIRSGKSTLFIEFMLGLIDEALAILLQEKPPVISAEDRISAFRNGCIQEIFTRKDYIQFFKNISTATASRDLQTATDQGIIHKTGDKNQTVYRFRTK